MSTSQSLTTSAQYGINGGAWVTASYDDALHYYVGQGGYRARLYVTTPNSSSIGKITQLNIGIKTDESDGATPGYMRAFLTTYNQPTSDYDGLNANLSSVIAVSKLYTSTAKTTRVSAWTRTTSWMYFVFTGLNLSKNTTYYIYLFPYDTDYPESTANFYNVNFTGTWLRSCNTTTYTQASIWYDDPETPTSFTQTAWFHNLIHSEGNNPRKDAYSYKQTARSGIVGKTYTISRTVTDIPPGFIFVEYSGEKNGTFQSYGANPGILTYGIDTITQEDFYCNNYSITYMMNNGINSSSNPSSYRVVDAFTFINPTRTGYTFKNWTRNSSTGAVITGINTNKIGAAMATSSPTNFYNDCSARDHVDMVVVANWTVNTYYDTIYHTYVATTGSEDTYFLQIADPNVGHTYGSTFTINTSNFHTLPNGFTGRNIYNYDYGSGGARATLGSITHTQSTSRIYFAIYYEPINYTITYDYNCTDSTKPTQPTSYNVIKGATFANPTRPGYKFLGWMNAATGAIITGVNEGATTPNVTTEIQLRNLVAGRTTGDITVRAIWDTQGLVYIANSSGKFEAYQCYVYDGGWKQVIPYVYNSGWKLCN